LIEQKDAGVNKCGVKLYAMPLDQDFKNKMSFDSVSQYAVFDMRKAYSTQPESVLGRFSTLDMDTEKKLVVSS